jgi:Family of unknown function (DUF6069)
MTTTTHETAPRRSATRGRAGRRASTVAAAVLAAVIVWLVAVPVAGLELRVLLGGAIQEVGIGSVVTVSLLATLIGWGLLALLERLLPARARTAWTAIAGSVLVLSLAGPLTGGTTPAVAATLALMHLAVGAVMILGLRRSARPVA